MKIKKIFDYPLYIRQNFFYVHYRLKKYRINKYLKENMSVLEIGSNLGTISNLLCKKTKKYTAIEPNNFKKKYDNKIYFHESNLENFILNNKKVKYDFILCLAVLRYTSYSIDEIIENLYNLLNDNGIVLIENTSHTDLEKKILHNVLLNNKFRLLSEGKIKEIDQTRFFYYIQKNI